MAQTYTVKAKVVSGNIKYNIVDITADAAYPEGNGYSLATADFEALMEPGRGITDMISLDAETNTGGYTVALDRTNSALKWVLGGVSATTTISSTTVRAQIYYGVPIGPIVP